MAVFYNRATLLFGGRAVNSNVTTGEVVEAIGITKTAVSSGYGPDDTVTYAVAITNSGLGELVDLTLTDDLGSFSVGESTVVPLEYVAGTMRLYVNGALAATPTVTAGPPLVVSGINIPAGGNAMLIYETRVGGYAPLAAGSVITNTATLTGARICTPVSDDATVAVRDEPILSITKSLEPARVACDGNITYTFIIQNTGNTAVIATDDLIVTDTFNPILTDITVTLNGVTLAEGVGYNYDETTGVFTTLPGQITLPAATYTRDPDTGLITTTPGVSILTINGLV